MNYYVNSRMSEAVGYPIEWYVTDDIGRWVHTDPFLTKEMAEAFLKSFLSEYVVKSQGDLLM